MNRPPPGGLDAEEQRLSRDRPRHRRAKRCASAANSRPAGPAAHRHGPPDTDGAAVAEKALAARPDLRVLFMSGYTEHPVLRLAGFPGAPFLHKPFTKAVLTAKVREVLQGERPERG